ncbi:oligosaccharide MFS transporter [Demequina sp. SYSU T00068]|uniref:oligosaccharide MFS transporter n=1 Tax=Demequina lignilytica TaxID=3051663 RepID=UPI00263510F6|nr:oligosaccharide MFS transporter [Demequina sp. SYSU T00068]MDN4490695.1 oligosaccharide MFS transporter [Demequina sp. SYSU T00068]
MSATPTPATSPSPGATPASSDRGLRGSLRRGVFWNYGGLYFFYFAIWQIFFSFHGLWFDQRGLGEGNIGLINTVMAITALCLQPLYGYLQDRLGLRKHLFAFVVLCGAMVGPFFAFVFTPLLGWSPVGAAVVSGMFMALVLLAGVSVVEAFNERASRANDFEYGHARLFGSLAGGTITLVAGWLWANVNPDSIWWAASFCALVLGALLVVARVPRQAAQSAAEGEHSSVKVSRAAVLGLVKDRSFLGFVVLMFGTAALYDVFDQQFSIYFAAHVDHGDPVSLFSYVVTIQIFAEAAVMLVAPWFVNRIGAKRGLQLFAAILVVRVLGSALVTTTEALIAWRLLAAIEMPLMLVSVMKYITRTFDVRISATAYMLGFGVAKSLGVAVFSLPIGVAYESIGFSNAYLVMSVAIVAVTVVASLLMRNDRPRGRGGADDAGAPAGEELATART